LSAYIAGKERALNTKNTAVTGPAEEKPTSLVSVIIPALNEEQFIPRCLAGVTSVYYPSGLIEIIVVDNGSTDRTVNLAREFGATVMQVPNKSVGFLRNAGAAAARGEILAFLDADCVPDKSWLFNATRVLSEEDCVTGSRVAVPKGSTWIEQLWYGGSRMGRYAVNYINSGNLVLRKDIFLQVGGFNEELVTGEDAEFCVRARKLVRIVADTGIRVEHLGNPRTLHAFFRREIWHGLGAFGTFRHALLDKPLLGTIIFLIGTATQATGAFLLLGSHQGCLTLLAGTLIVSLLLLATVLFRIWSNPSMKWDSRLLLLYYTYYLGRSLSLLFLLIGKERVQRSR